jgi:single-strand DNA-binding protein
MINLAQVLGRVGKINHKMLSGDQQVTNMSMVTTEKFTKNGEKQEKATWHNVTVYNKLSMIVQKYVNEGDLLYIKGKMDTQKYKDKEGNDRYKSFIVADDIRLMPRNKAQSADPAPVSKDDAFSDDCPF